jgi:hypothetical protein
MKPFKHNTGRWAVQFSAKNSGTGRRQMRYYSSEREALADIRKWTQERNEFGRSSVTAEERNWINFARQQLGNLDVLPEVIAHWKAPGSGSITPTLIPEAVRQFKAWQLPRVKLRTKSDINWRLGAFSQAFPEQNIHQLNAGDLETWLYKQGKPWSIRSFYKRLRPLFDYAMRHRMLAENPMLLLKAPEVPGEVKTVYSTQQLNQLLLCSIVPHKDFTAPEYLTPFLCLTAFAWMRTSELVRQYASEDVLCYEDIEWSNNRIHIRETVGKNTRRRSGNERWIPMTKHLVRWLQPFKDRKGRIVPVLHQEFAESMRKLHIAAEVPLIPNGLRRSAISYYLAAHPETGIGELARRAETSEATVKRHYCEALTPEISRGWFELKKLAGSKVIFTTSE